MQPTIADPTQTTAYKRRWFTLIVLSTSLLIIGLDNTILNVAIPTLQREFNASATSLQWMVDAYVLVFAGLLLTMGASRRPIRTQTSAPSRTRHIRAFQPLRHLCRLQRPTHRRAGTDGHRRCTHHAVNSLHNHQRIPKRGTWQGDRNMGRRRRSRHRHRTRHRWIASRKLLVGFRILRQHSNHRCRTHRRLHPRSRKP